MKRKSILLAKIMLASCIVLGGCGASLVGTTATTDEHVESEQSAETVQDEQTSQAEETKQEKQGKITYDDLNTGVS